MTPCGCLSLPRGYIHVYDHCFQTSSPLKPFGQSKPNIMRSLLGKGNKSLYIWSRSHDQDGRHAHIWCKPLKIFSYRTYSHMIMKLGMGYFVLKFYEVYIHDDPELSLTYFTTMSNLAKIYFVLIVGPDIR